MLSHAMQDYLKVIYELQEAGDTATTSNIANRLGVAPASVTNMVKRLARKELVRHEPYYGATLTARGERAALEVVRAHRLIETFLAEALGIPWDRVHDEAHLLEHAASNYLLERIAAVLNHPEFDPHGKRIPTVDGRMLPVEAEPLSRIEVGQHATIAYVDDENAELLRYLGVRQLYPGNEVELVERGVFREPMRVRVQGNDYSVGLGAAEHVWVEINGSIGRNS